MTSTSRQAVPVSSSQAWGSPLVDVGSKGHINSASGLGMWSEGFALVEELASPGR